jgi:DNA-binding transcriptional LysR family regulator
MIPSVQRLAGFYWVARSGGYARAARAFPYPITQPGVHQQVRRLEQELGVALFERVGRDAMRPTPAGARLYAFCAPFFEELPRVVRALQSGELGGTLRIDATGLVLRHLLPDWLLRLRRAREDVEVELQEVETPDPGRLRTGETDLIVDYGLQRPDGCDAQVVGYSYAHLVLPAQHRLARRKRIAGAELSGEPFVAYHPSLRQHAVQMAAVRARVGNLGRVTSASSVDTILAQVQAGLGYSVIPWLDRTGPKLRGVVVRPQTGPGTRFEVTAVWRRQAPLSQVVAAALACAPQPRTSSAS